MPGALLDTNALCWFVANANGLTVNARLAIAQNQETGTLYVSPISAWELSIAVKKPAHKNPPDLGDLSASKWFSLAVSVVGAKVIPIKQRIACEAAAVVDATGHKDPGDCYLIATARVRNIPIITRDGFMQELAEQDYLQVIVC